MKAKTGGPAFPIVGTPHDVKVNEGMSLRDYFAAAAIAGCARNEGSEPEWWNEPRWLVGRAYAIADEMLKHRG